MRPHLLVASSFVLSAGARQSSIHTSSVSYCVPPTTILVQQFDVTFFKFNQSIVFDITAQSITSVNVSGTVTLNAYGLTPVKMDFDLCALTSILCPLPQYTFNGSGTLPIPSSFTSKIPSLAFTVPDLEAFAQLTLIDASTQQQVACVQATLTNGLTMRQISVSWATCGLAIVAALASLIFTTNSHSKDDRMYVDDDRSPNSGAWRVIDYVAFVQHIVVLALLDLNYPLAFTEFALNFSWAFGLFAMGHKSHIQTSINNLRLSTGSSNSASAVNPITYANRKQSPYNERRSFDPVSDSTTVTPTVSSGTVLNAGVPSYVNALRISTTNAYMSVFFTALILIAIVLVIFALGYAILLVTTRKGKHAKSKQLVLRGRYPSFMLTIFVRVALIMILPLTALSFYQWTLGDAWLPVLLSVLLGIWVWAVLVYAGVSAYRAHRVSILFETPTFAALGALYEPYRSSHWFFTLCPLIPAVFVKCLFIAFAQKSGLAQIIGLLVVEVFTLGAWCVCRPHLTRGADALSIVLGVFKLVSVGLLIAFDTRVGVKPIPRVVIGLVLAAITSIGMLLVIFNMITDVIVTPLVRLVRRPRNEDLA